VERKNAGELFTDRIEELLQRSNLPPETVLNIMRAAHTDPGFDPIAEIERLSGEQSRKEV
jgi:hypothetical protein